MVRVRDVAIIFNDSVALTGAAVYTRHSYNTTTPSPHLSPDSPSGYDNASLIYGASPGTHSNQQSPLLPLFDPQQPDRPNPALMMHFIQTYFDHYGSSFPCLAYDETIRQFLDHSLSPLIATGMAALAAW